MKRTFTFFTLTLFALLTFAPATAQNKKEKKEVAQGGPKIEFEKKVHDYGTIKQNADGTCYFKFKNTGDEPLVISNAKGSCGCTVPSWPKKPIQPGKTDKIEVEYDTKRIGPINKSVRISSNAKNKSTMTLRIKGKVEKKKNSPSKKEKKGAPVKKKK
ncbi:MAG: DUF1573 domain-containing protein [Flavobacteriales bacterium]